MKLHGIVCTFMSIVVFLLNNLKKLQTVPLMLVALVSATIKNSTQSATFTVAAVADLSEQVFITGKPNPRNITSYERHPDSKLTYLSPFTVLRL